MRLLAAALILLPAACTAGRDLHPAVAAGAAMTDELRLSFFESFDDASFRALAERAFRERLPEAEKLLNDVVWNWHPDLRDKAGLRRRARLLLPPLAAHPDPRVREGIWRLGRFLYNEPETSAAWSSALPDALSDDDPDVRLAAIETSLDLHAGWTGGCVIEAKITSFSLHSHSARLAKRLLEEPDERVRRALLRAAAWEGRRRFLPSMVRYFTEADRRGELPSMCGSVWTMFANPEEGLDALLLRPPEDLRATWARLKDFAAALQGTPAARRNGIVLLLLSAATANASLEED